jgi:ankyrin repeat protein
MNSLNQLHIPNKQGYSPIHKATEQINPEIVHLLKVHGGLYNIPKIDGNNLLHLVIKTGNREIIDDVM